MARGCGVFGHLHVRRYSNLLNRESLRRTYATTGAARPRPVVSIGLGTHCPVNTCIAAYTRLGLVLYHIAVYPRPLHSILGSLPGARRMQGARLLGSLPGHMSPWRTRYFGFPALNCLCLICLFMLRPMPCDCCAACTCGANEYMTLTTLTRH